MEDKNNNNPYNNTDSYSGTDNTFSFNSQTNGYNFSDTEFDSDESDNKTLDNSYASDVHSEAYTNRDEEGYDGEDEEEYDEDLEMQKIQHKKKIRAFNIILYCIAGILILFGVYILVMESDLGILISNKNKELNALSEEDYYDAISKGEVIKTFEPLGTPVSHYDAIPVQFTFVGVKVNGERKKISCNVYPVGYKNGGMETVETAEDCSWLSQYPYVAPGEIGNAVIAGHNLWKGKAGTFSLIKNLKVGDTVSITMDKGFERQFEVVEVGTCKYNDKSIMKSDVNEPILTLVTCAGDWSHELQQSVTRVYAICKPIVH